MKTVFSILIFLLCAPLVQAQNATTVGSLVLLSSLHAISVKANYTGDANTNNSVVIEYRQNGTTTWLPTVIVTGAPSSPFLDRGANANYGHQARVSIVGLSENTAYDVRATWSDIDGCTNGGMPCAGNPVVQMAFSTITLSPTPGAGTCNASDSASLSTCLNGSQLLINLAANTYNAFTIGRSGSAGNYLVINCAANVHISSGGGTTPNIQVNGSFVVVKGCDLPHSSGTGVQLGNNVHDIYVQNNTMESISENCADAPMMAHYTDAGVDMTNGGGAGTGGPNIVISGNSITASAALAGTSCNFNPNYNSPGSCMRWGGMTSLIAYNNTCSGPFRDGITNDDDLQTENVDIEGNTISGYKDDGAESKSGNGGNINVRIWDNVITASLSPAGCSGTNDNPANTNPCGANTCFAFNTNAGADFGPAYIFRNTCKMTANPSSGTTTYKIGGAGNYFVFHNSVQNIAPAANFDGFTGATTGTFRNNISQIKGSVISATSSTGSYDYQLYDWTDTGCCNFVFSFGGASYQSLAAFQAANPSQETHGKQTAAGFDNSGTLHLAMGSAAIDAGVVLNNFNDSTSCPGGASYCVNWPFKGTAPDIGAFEFNSAPPSGLIMLTGPGGGLIGPASGLVSRGGIQ